MDAIFAHAIIVKSWGRGKTKPMWGEDLLHPSNQRSTDPAIHRTMEPSNQRSIEPANQRSIEPAIH